MPPHKIEYHSELGDMEKHWVSANEARTAEYAASQ